MSFITPGEFAQKEILLCRNWQLEDIVVSKKLLESAPLKDFSIKVLSNHTYVRILNTGIEDEGYQYEPLTQSVTGERELELVLPVMNFQQTEIGGWQKK